MKKFLAIMLTLALMIGLVACGGSDADAKKVAEYVDKNGASLIQSMEQSFATLASGMTCTSTIKAEGCGIVIDMRFDQINDVPESAKTQMQDALDSMDSLFDAMLEMVQKELPELDYLTVNYCESDGDVLATIEMD